MDLTTLQLLVPGMPDRKNTEEQNSQEKKGYGKSDNAEFCHMEMNPPLKQLWQKIQIIFLLMDRDSAIEQRVSAGTGNYGK